MSVKSYVYREAVKLCNECGAAKEPSEFHRDASKPDGRHSRCKDCRRASSRQRHHDRRETELERLRAYQAAHRDEHLQRCRAYYEANRDRLLQQARSWAAANPERKAANMRAWSAANADKRSEADLRRRAAKLVGVVEDVRRGVVWDRDQGLCALCGEPADQSKWHLEHLTPLVRGGEHNYENVAVAHPLCNQSKGTRTLAEWLFTLPG